MTPEETPKEAAEVKLMKSTNAVDTANATKEAPEETPEEAARMRSMHSTTAVDTATATEETPEETLEEAAEVCRCIRLMQNDWIDKFNERSRYCKRSWDAPQEILEEAGKVRSMHSANAVDTASAERRHLRRRLERQQK